MFEPVGPLPAAVYWRRRCLALASAVSLVALVAATAGAPARAPVPTADRVPTATKPTTPPAAGPNLGAEASTGPSAAPSAAEGTRDTVPSDGTAPAGAIAGSVAPTSSTPIPSPSAVGPSPAPSSRTGGAGPTAAPDPFSAQALPGAAERIRPDDTPRPSAAPSSAAVPSTGPGPCTNAMLSVAAQLDHPVHRVGSHPVLRLVITDVAGRPCVRDLDSARQEIVVWSADGRDRLWSSNDCVNAPSIDLRTLLPDRPVAFAVTWGERTTTPGCRTPRTLVPAGTYRLMVRLDDLISGPTPFIRMP